MWNVLLQNVLCIIPIEAVAQTFSVKKVFLEISQNSRENTCARVSILIKLQAWAFSYRTPQVAASVPIATNVPRILYLARDMTNLI